LNIFSLLLIHIYIRTSFVSLVHAWYINIRGCMWYDNTLSLCMLCISVHELWTISDTNMLMHQPWSCKLIFDEIVDLFKFVHAWRNSFKVVPFYFKRLNFTILQFLFSLISWCYYISLDPQEFNFHVIGSILEKLFHVCIFLIQKSWISKLSSFYSWISFNKFRASKSNICLSLFNRFKVLLIEILLYSFYIICSINSQVLKASRSKLAYLYSTI